MFFNWSAKRRGEQGQLRDEPLAGRGEVCGWAIFCPYIHVDFNQETLWTYAQGLHYY